MFQKRISWVTLQILFALVLFPEVFAQEDATRKRKAFMNESYDALKAIKRAVAQKDYPTIELKAKDIMGHMDDLLDYFPKGSISEKSKSKPEIWEKWDEFSKLPVKVKDVANALARAAARSDEVGVQEQFQALGVGGSPYRPGVCYDCHKSFVIRSPQSDRTGGDLSLGGWLEREVLRKIANDILASADRSAVIRDVLASRERVL